MSKPADLQLLWDHLQLRNLYAQYCFGLDYHDDAELLDCFEPDGTFSLSDRGDFQGHEAIQAILDASASTRNRHHILNLLIDEVDGDVARCRAYFILMRPDDAGIISWGHYRDEAVRSDDGKWRWRRKRVEFDWRSEDYAQRSESQTTDKLLRS
jgi:hypothetical protein